MVEMADFCEATNANLEVQLYKHTIIFFHSIHSTHFTLHEGILKTELSVLW